jgi:hypothetical protein
VDVLAPQVLVEVEGDVVVALHGGVEAGVDPWFHWWPILGKFA